MGGKQDPVSREAGFETRPIESGDIAGVAQLWWRGWQDAHSRILPAELARLRTLASFEDRLRAAGQDARLVAPSGSPLGFYLLKGDELNQFFVAEEARGTGLAAALIADAEDELSGRGIALAWLACAIGNDRAARFYQKAGWKLAGEVVINMKTSEGGFDLKVWRYEKRLSGG